MSPWRVLIGYIVGCVLAVTLAAMPLVPLGYEYFSKFSSHDAWVSRNVAALTDLSKRDGPAAVAAAIRSQLSGMPAERLLVFADPDKRVLAGTLRDWPRNAPDQPVHDRPIRVDAPHANGESVATNFVINSVILPGGYRLIVGRKVAILREFEKVVWYGLAGTIAVVLVVGAVVAVLLARRRQAVRVSEERYERVVLASEAGLWDYGVAKDEYYVSPALLKLCGFPPGTTFSGREDFMQRAPWVPEDREKFKQAVTELFASGGSRMSMEVRYLREGETRWVDLAGMCFRDTAGKVVRWTGSATDITERKRAEMRLQQSEQRYALAMDATADGHMDWNFETGEFYLSPRMKQIVGHPPDATFTDRDDWVRRFPFHPEDRTRWEAAIAAHFAGREAIFKMDARVIVNGETRWLAFNFIAKRDAAGKVVRWTGSIADINDAKRDVATVIESIPGLVAILTSAGELEAVSDQLAEYCGQPVEVLKHWGTNGTVHPEDVPHGAETFTRGISTGQAYEFEARVRRFDGVYRWNVIRGEPYRDTSGRIVRWYSTLSDLDDRKRAEQALRLSEERYALAVAGANDGIWDEDYITGMLYRSPRNQEIALGRPSDGIDTRTRAEWEQWHHVHPDDAPKRDAALSAHLEGRTPHYEVEYRVRHPDGTYHWIHARGVCTRDESGRALHIAGSTTDIDSRKAAEEALRESQERYALALEAAEEGHFDNDLRTNQIFVSARTNEIYGFPRKPTVENRLEFLAKMPIHPDDRHVVDGLGRSDWEDPAAELHEIECRIVPRPGEIRWIHSRAKVTRDAEGRPLRRIGVVADITDRKRAEALLAAEKDLLEMMARAAPLATVLDRLCRVVDENLGGYLSGILLVDADRKQLVLGAGPNLPREYLQAIDGAAMSPDAGPCGMSTSTNHETICVDVATEKRWESWPSLALSHGLRSCWSTPIVSSAQKVLGAFGVYARHPGSPTSAHRAVVERFTHLAAVAIERLRGEEALREQTERLQLGQAAMRMIIMDWNLADDVLTWSDSPEWLRGPIPASGDYSLFKDQVHPLDRDSFLATRQRALDTLEVQTTEFRLVRTDGEVIWVLERKYALAGADGKAARMLAAMVDITERKRAEEALHESQDLFARAVAGSADGIWDIDLVARSVFFSPRTRELCGLPPGPEVVPLDGWFEALPLHPEDLPRRMAAVQAHLSGQAPAYDGEFRFLQPDGVYRWRHLHGVCVRDAGGKPLRMAGSMSDVDDRRRAEEALQISEERYALALEAAEEGHFDSDLVTNENFASARTNEIFGLPRQATITNRLETLAQMPIHPDDRRILGELGKPGWGDPAVDLQEIEFRIVPRPGEIRWIHSRAKVVCDAQGRPRRRVGVVADITERKRAEDALRESQLRYERAMFASRAGYWDYDLATDAYYLSPAMLDLAGFAPDTPFYGRDDFLRRTPFHPPEERDNYLQAVRELFAGDGIRLTREVRLLVDGDVRWINMEGMCLRDAAGKVTRWTGFATDITKRKHAEEDLRRMEAQLRSAQRLEALGTLAGGIAHDFNNILGAILGYGEMAVGHAKKGSRLRRDLDSIMAAGERGRALVDRVLAFSRSGIADRVPVHVEAIVREALDQVAASLPEEVAIARSLRAGQAAILGDATQVHQVVMNLATNAVQAMPKGGTLRVTLETVRFDTPQPVTVGSIVAGEYLVLKVNDSGTGIPDSVLERMFDPFFTTKEVGVGSGLGLSLVHGIVTSMDGAINVQTRIGKGTTFTVHLRRSGSARAEPASEDRPLPRGAGQRVLVVDDEEPLVRLATATLEGLGYAPVGFTSSEKALEEFGADPGRFDAIITDERMPGVTGSKMIKEVRRINGSIPILLMSGFVSAATALKARELGASDVLKKPLLARELAASLARALES